MCMNSINIIYSYFSFPACIIQRLKICINPAHDMTNAQGWRPMTNFHSSDHTDMSPHLLQFQRSPKTHKSCSGKTHRDHHAWPVIFTAVRWGHTAISSTSVIMGPSFRKYTTHIKSGFSLEEIIADCYLWGRWTATLLWKHLDAFWTAGHSCRGEGERTGLVSRSVNGENSSGEGETLAGALEAHQAWHVPGVWTVGVSRVEARMRLAER